MSYVRFGVDGSQVYVYPDVAGYVRCCGCGLTKRLPDRSDEELAALWVPLGMDREAWGRKRWEPDFHTTDLDAMLAHLAEHRQAGHRVPDWVDDDLRGDWPKFDSKETTR